MGPQHRGDQQSHARHKVFPQLTPRERLCHSPAARGRGLAVWSPQAWDCAARIRGPPRLGATTAPKSASQVARPMWRGGDKPLWDASGANRRVCWRKVRPERLPGHRKTTNKVHEHWAILNQAHRAGYTISPSTPQPAHVGPRPRCRTTAQHTVTRNNKTAPRVRRSERGNWRANSRFQRQGASLRDKVGRLGKSDNRG